jgi:prefoldin subunit 5
MKKITKIILICAAIFFCGVSSLYSEDKNNSDVTIPPGTELQKVGDVQLVVPIGSKIRKEGNLIFMQNAEEYTAERYLEIENKLRKIDENIESLKLQIKELKQQLSSSANPAAESR